MEIRWRVNKRSEWNLLLCPSRSCSPASQQESNDLLAKQKAMYAHSSNNANETKYTGVAWRFSFSSIFFRYSWVMMICGRVLVHSSYASVLLLSVVSFSSVFLYAIVVCLFVLGADSKSHKRHEVVSMCVCVFTHFIFRAKHSFNQHSTSQI